MHLPSGINRFEVLRYTVDVVVVVVEGYAKSVALASDTVSRVWVDMTPRVVGVNP